MRKILLACFFIGSILEARFYFGLEGGYLGNYLRYNQTYQGSPSYNAEKGESFEKSTYGQGGIAGIIMGFEHHFEKTNLVTRSLLFGGYGKNFYEHANTGEKTAFEKFYAGIGGDVIWNLSVNPKKFEFGVFFGGGAEWSLLTQMKPFKIGTAQNEISDEGHHIYMIFRLGLTTLINDHHRFEILAKSSAGQEKPKNKLRTAYGIEEVQILDMSIRGLLSYKYVF